LKTILTTRKISGLGLLCTSINNPPATKAANSNNTGNHAAAFTAGCPVLVTAGSQTGELKLRTGMELKFSLRIAITDKEGNVVAQRVVRGGETCIINGLKRGICAFRIYCSSRELSSGTIIIR
jgi:hypothetical protein